MATFRVVVQKHHLKSDGTYNIKIRVIHQRKVRYIATPYFEPKNEFNKKLDFRNPELRLKYANIEQQYRDAFAKIAQTSESMNIDQVVDFVKREIANGGSFSLNLFDYGRTVAERKSAGSRQNYLIALNSLKRFCGSDILDISDVTTRLLKEWAEWLQKDNQGKPVKGRGVSLYLGYLRAIHNEAKREFNDEELGTIHIKGSPFSRFSLPAQPVTRKRALSTEQIRQLVEYKPTSIREELARDIFLLSFMLIGMNSADLYTCKILRENRIIYYRQKTASRRIDKAEMQVIIHRWAKPIVEKYSDTEHKYIFNFYNRYANKSTFNAAINKGLKKIGTCLGIDDLEFYAARHSWATIARNECNIDQYTVHAALNHVDERMRVTDIYLVKDWGPVNEANKLVLQHVFGETFQL